VYGTQALRLSGIKQPDIFVVADDVTRGKPFPEPYLMTAEKLNVDPAKCKSFLLCFKHILTAIEGVVIEDAPAGVTSGKAAGCKVIAVCTSHSRERMAQTEADWLIEDLTK
jgi:glycerol 3-phosphatase-1